MYRSPFPFLGLPEPDPEMAQAILLPVPYEATTSYGKGTAKGPQALLQASAYVEIYDEVRDRQPALHPDFSEEISRYWTAPRWSWKVWDLPPRSWLWPKSSVALPSG
jgi:agmatinase